MVPLCIFWVVCKPHKKNAQTGEEPILHDLPNADGRCLSLNCKTSASNIQVTNVGLSNHEKKENHEKGIHECGSIHPKAQN